MAGAGFKDFAVGEVLTASDVDTYLMQQSVMRFADAAARGSALGTATGTAVPLAEGMVSYLDDADALQYFDGTVWGAVTNAGVGTNVVQAVKTDGFTSTSATPTAVTGLSVSFTPTTASSKVLVMLSVSGGADTTARNVDVYLYRDGSAIGTGSDGASYFFRLAATTELKQLGLLYLDAPATTSAVTYDVRVAIGGGDTASINRRAATNDLRGISTLTAIEVAA